jgi:N6-adenosine-specific RNA methylase IME4
MNIVIDAEFRALIPALQEEEYKQLEANIIAAGRARDPLVVWRQEVEATLIDGHNRYEICKRHGLPYEVVAVGETLETREDVMDWIDKNQLGRRNLHPDAFSLIVGRRYNRAKKAEHDGGKGKERSGDQIEPHFKTADIIAQQHNVSPATVKRAGQLAQAVEAVKAAQPDIERQVMSGQAAPKAAIVHAARIMAEKPEEAKSILSGEKKIADVVREEKRAEKLAEVERKCKDVEIAAGKKKYRVIYADPPWAYATPQHSKEAQVTTLDTHYPSMATEDICKLPISDMCEDDAVLFMWGTSPLLRDAMQVIEAWGFTYKASMVWDKVKHNVGHYVSVRHEFLFIATRGSCTPDNKTLHDSVHTEERTEHSVKPEHFRTVIDDIYRIGNRIELFARRAAEGWDVWGNQA